MPRKTKAQIGLLLADLYAAQNDKRKAEQREKDLKAEIADLELKEGPYGEMTYALGTPREILDQKEAKRIIEESGKKVPKVFTAAPIVVKPLVR